MRIQTFMDTRTPIQSGLSQVYRVTIRHASIPKDRRLAVTCFLKRLAEKHPTVPETVGVKFSNQSVSLFFSRTADPKMVKYFGSKLRNAMSLEVDRGNVIRK